MKLSLRKKVFLKCTCTAFFISMGTIWQGSHWRVCAFIVRIHLNFANLQALDPLRSVFILSLLQGLQEPRRVFKADISRMPGTVPDLGTSGESQVTFAGALHLCPVKEGEKKYGEEKSGWCKDRVRKTRAEDEKWSHGETGVSGMDTSEHQADDQGKNRGKYWGTGNILWWGRGAGGREKLKHARGTWILNWGRGFISSGSL